MKLFKIIAVFFLFYFIRRFMQMYREMREFQDNQIKNNTPNHEHQAPPNKDSAIEADYKVVD